MENMENKMQTTELSPREEYHQEFLPQVHKIGAATMAIALILSLLPTIYFVFIKGIEVPLSTFISVMIATSRYVACAAIRVKAAYSPAEALFNRLARNPCMGVKPACLAAIPREKDTAKYPRAMGKPSRIPSQNIFLLNLSFIIMIPSSFCKASFDAHHLL